MEYFLNNIKHLIYKFMIMKKILIITILLILCSCGTTKQKCDAYGNIDNIEINDIANN